MTKKKPSPRQARAQPGAAPDTCTLVLRSMAALFISRDSRRANADRAEALWQGSYAP